MKKNKNILSIFVVLGLTVFSDALAVHGPCAGTRSHDYRTRSGTQIREVTKPFLPSRQRRTPEQMLVAALAQLNDAQRNLDSQPEDLRTICIDRFIRSAACDRLFKPSYRYFVPSEIRDCIIDRLFELYGVGENGALVWAARNGYIEIVLILLADQRVTAYGVSRALWEAARNGYIEIVQILLADQRVNPDGEDMDRIVWFISLAGNIEIVRILLADQRITRNGVYNALRVSTINGYIEIVQILLADQRVTPDSVNDVLAEVAINGHEKIVQILRDWLLLNGGDE